MLYRRNRFVIDLWLFVQGLTVEYWWPCVPIKFNRLRTFRQDRLGLYMLFLFIPFFTSQQWTTFFSLLFSWLIFITASKSCFLSYFTISSSIKTKIFQAASMFFVFDFVFFPHGNMTSNFDSCHCKIFNRVSVSKTLRRKQKGDAVWESCQAWTSYEEIFLG